MSTNQNIQLYTDNSAGQRDMKIQVHAERTPKSTIPRPKTQKYDKLTVWFMPGDQHFRRFEASQTLLWKLLENALTSLKA
ncbi:hypothetical protein F8M41_022792 [Gigaspora margarita]|uniref:Uncharacterized protein n=1 Tax=Gigaspora margarita TaxID=4874 RepID=A0A8H4EHT5_GIGMA|nr:hypothetical protein F8M41_022792 [Gigaspora margarita]